MNAQAARPICQFCHQPEGVRQITVRGKIVWLHMICDRGYEQFVAPKPTPLQSPKSAT